ncbi:MAG: hypothetical protein ABI216_00980 [Devosia sp.]
MSAGGACAAECNTSGRTNLGNQTSLPGSILGVTGGGTDSCELTGVSNILPVAGADKFVVYKVTSRGFNALNDGDRSTYTVSSNGQTKIVVRQGETFDDFTVEQYFTAGQGPTNFAGTFALDLPVDGETDIDSLDFLVGYTTLASQQNSLNEIGLQQLGIATHLDATAGLLTGANQPLEGDNEIGLLGGVGSYTVGVTGRYNLAEGFSLLGGASIVNFGMPGASASGVLAAGALRFVQPGASEFKYFGEAGLQVASLDLNFSRHYDNGTTANYAATASGDGLLGGVYARGGVLWAPNVDNDVLFSATLKQGALGIGNMAEDDPSSSPNLFAADYSKTNTSFTTIKGSVDWTAKLTPSVDLTASLGVGTAFGNGGATANVFGVGTVTGAAQSTLFAEYGVRLGWTPTEDTRIDGFVTGSTGTGIGTHAQIGAAYHLKF